MIKENKKQIISLLFQKNYLVSPNLINQITDNSDFENIKNNIEQLEKQEKMISISEELFLQLVSLPKEEINQPEKGEYNINIINSYTKDPIKKEMQHFVSYFKARYQTLSKILQGRQELQTVVSLNKLKNKPPKEKVAAIGIVSEISTTKNGNFMITLEDPTDSVKFVLSKTRKETFEKTKEIVLDEVIGIDGTTGGGIIFVNDIYFPDIPLNKEFKKSPDEVYAAFISDIHVGSDMFLPKDFEKFISWINGQKGTNEQKKMALKVKYLFIIGDLVDGIGIYPDQDKELVIKDIYEQYEECAKYLSKIRQDIKIIICGGNHDAMRIAEPQPCLDKKYAKSIYQLPNVINVSNPSTINIHKKDGFPGFDVLMYHGYSFDYYVSNVDKIRNNGGYDRADLIMEFLLKKRHLAPSHTSTLYIPDNEKDPLVIDKIPDFFITGHIHKVSSSSYRNVTTLCGSCWQAKTGFQEKVGHNPEPSIVPIVNLQTRQVKLMKFSEEEDES